MPTFADRLKQLRERAGLTQAALALQSGLSLGIVRDYEQGRKEPALRSAFKLAEALGVDCSAFKDCIDADAPEDAEPSAKAKRSTGQAEPSLQPPDAELAKPRGRPRKDASAAAEQAEPPSGSTRSTGDAEGETPAKKTRRRRGS